MLDVNDNKAAGPKYNEDVEELNTVDIENPDELITAGDTDDNKRGRVVGEGDDEKLAAKDEKDKSGDEDEIDEDADEGDEGNEKDNEKPDIPFDRPSLSEVKAKFPNFFKEFPSLRDAFYREVEFTRLFPTVADAKEAFEDNEAFVSLREDVIKGNSEPLLDAIESQSKEGIELFSQNFLVTLHKKSPEVFKNVLTPVLEGVCRQLYASKDEDDRNAALRLSAFLFGTTEVSEGKVTYAKKVEQPKEKDGSGEAKFNQVLGEVGNKSNAILGQMISKDLDPEKVLSPFIRKQVIRECVDEIQRQLGNDKAHLQVMKARWKRANINNYQEDDQAKIISAFLARAKSLIPSVRSKIMQAALGVHSSANGKKREKIENGLHKEYTGGGSSSSAKSEVKKIDYRKMSDADILAM